MGRTSIFLLLVDDNIRDISTFYKLLTQEKESDIKNYEISHAKTLQQAFLLLQSQTYDLIITSLQLTDSKGIETFHAIKKNAEKTPIIIIDDSADEILALEIIRQGAQDVLLRSELKKQLLDRAIRHALERHQLQMKLRMQSFTDDLTRLYNRRGFITLIEQQIEIANRTHKGFFLFFIDLDYLKDINDNFGHPEGDNALTNAANVLRKSFRHSDIICRLGGDEFAIIGLGTPQDEGSELKNHLYEILKNYNIQKTHSYTLSFTTGMAFYNPQKPISIEELLDLADKDLYTNKRLRHKN